MLTVQSEYIPDGKWSKDCILQWIERYQISYGIQDDVIRELEDKKDIAMFPRIIAKGKERLNELDPSL